MLWSLALWNAFFSRFRLSWVMPSRLANLFNCWWTGGRSRSVAVWKMVPSYLMWCLWRKRNYLSFEDRERKLVELFFFFFHFLFLWTTAFVARLVLSFYDFLVLFSLSTKMFLLYTPCVTNGAFGCWIRILFEYTARITRFDFVR